MVRLGGKILWSSKGKSGLGSSNPNQRIAYPDPINAFNDVPTALSVAVLILLFGLLAVLALKKAGDCDIGFHLKTGEYILSGYAWPRADPFTFTVRDHPYINPSWGYDVFVAVVYRMAGISGLIIFHGLFVLATFLVVLRTTRLLSAESVTLGLLILLGGIASEMRFKIRPELISYLMAAIILHLLHRYSIKKTSPLWLLIPIHLIWANVHSIFVLGWMAELCFIIGMAVRDRRFDRRLLFYFFASIIVAFVNPYSWKGVTHFFTLATRFQGEQVFTESIGEFISPFALRLSEQFPFYPRAPIFTFYVFVLLSMIALIPALKQKRFEIGLLWLVSILLSSKMIRNIPIFILVCLPMIVWWLPLRRCLDLVGIKFRNRAWVLRAISVLLVFVTIGLGLLVVHDAYYLANRRQDRFGLGWSQLSLPIEATKYVLRSGLDGPVLNDLSFGGYLMWALPIPVFIDGRLEVIGEEFFDEYHRIMTSAESLEACVARYSIRWIIFKHMFHTDLLSRLSRDARWQLIYVDPLAAIFVRKGDWLKLSHPPMLPMLPAGIREILSLHDLPGIQGSYRPSRLRRWLSGLIHQQHFPSEDFNLGLFHFYRGEMDQAANRFGQAIQQSNGFYYEIYFNLGLSLDQLRRYEEAQACFNVVLQDDPKNRFALKRLGY